MNKEKCVYCSMENKETHSVHDDIDWMICDKHKPLVDQSEVKK